MTTIHTAEALIKAWQRLKDSTASVERAQQEKLSAEEAHAQRVADATREGVSGIFRWDGDYYEITKGAVRKVRIDDLGGPRRHVVREEASP